MKESVGQPLSRIDGRLKVAGRATYSAENFPKNLTQAVLVMSTIPKGRIASMDTRAAEKVPGVLTVMTPRNAPKLPVSQKKPGPIDRILSVFQDDKVYYANQPIGVVVAETLEAATYAASLVRVKYVTEAYEVSLTKRIPTAYDPKKVGGGGDPSASNRGDVKAGMDSAAAKIAHVYSTPYETHNPMEPHATVAVWEGKEKLTLYDTTQGVFLTRQRVAEIMGLHPDNVHVISPYLGGGFGCKSVWSQVIIAVMAARQLDRPVKLVMDRPQMFGSLGYRPQTHQEVAAGAAADGTLLALRHDTITHTSSFDVFVEPASLTARMLYNSANNSTSHRLVRTDTGTPTFMRAPGECPGTYALECAMDELAYALKMDPVALRLKNYAEEDPDKDRPFSSKSLRECYKLGADRFGWEKRTPEPRSMRKGNQMIGWGMATSLYPTHRSASSAVARLRADGTALVEAATQDLGTGTYTIMTQMTADALGLSTAQVVFRLGDTAFPETPISGGSQTAASTGSAVHLAGLALREKLTQMAVSDSSSPLYQASVQDIVIEEGRLMLKDNRQRGETYQAMMQRQGKKEVEAHADTKPGEEQKKYSMYAFGAQFAEVHVDADLGQIRVSRMVGAFAAGKILNPKTARSQFIGGMVWGISMALHEETKLDERLGRIVNNNLAEYHVPVNLDVPAIEALWVDEKDEHVNPIGVKGIGEIGNTGAAAAIANAIFHATGKRIRDLPITLDKLLS